MKISDLLRKVADQVDGIEDDPVVDQSVLDPEDTDDAQYLPPLQAKMELLKKSEGMPNAYEEEGEEGEEGDDELNHIKRNAGLNISSTKELADDDGPFEG
jgi:hypothetical protein